MNEKRCPTFWVKIYIAGRLDAIEQACRKFCLDNPRCVTVEKTTFVFTGGAEEGAVVGLINYPRFPSTIDEILEVGNRLALELLDATCQHSVLVMTPEETKWITKRDTP